MNPSPRPAVLRPRELVVTLFAGALDGDERALDDLRALAPDDERAAAALGAIVVTEIDTRFHADPDGHDLPPGTAMGLAGALAAIDRELEPAAAATVRCALAAAARAAGGRDSEETSGGTPDESDDPAMPLQDERVAGGCAPCRRGDHWHHDPARQG